MPPDSSALSAKVASAFHRTLIEVVPLAIMAAGGSDGRVRVFDLADGTEVASFTAGHDTTNGCQYHPFLPLLSTASGVCLQCHVMRTTAHRCA